MPDRPSIITGIANRVIDFTPAEIRESLISLVGTAAKPLLGIGIILVIVGVGAIVGIRWRDRAHNSWPVFVVLAGVLALFTVTDTTLWGVVPPAIGATAGWVIFSQLLKVTIEYPHNPDNPPIGTPVPALSRRRFLITSGIIGGTTAAGIALIAGVKSISLRTVETARSAIKIPAPIESAPPVSVGAAVDVPGMPGPVTSNPDFYRIDTALTPPTVDVQTWSLDINGRVRNPLSLSYADLMAMPQVQRYVTLTCVSNEVGGDLVGNAMWQGVLLETLLDKVGVDSAADQVVGESVDGFTAAFPLQLAVDGREPMVAVAMNGEPLPVLHGYPARLVVPGLYGYVSATKWLSQIRLTTAQEESFYWADRGWIADGRIAAASRIDVAKNGARVAVGSVAIAGRAWHQNVAIGRVEVSIDGGPWQTTQLADSLGLETWRLWKWQWAAQPGDHTVQVRMIDASGAVQSKTETAPGPGPSSGYDQIQVSVQ